MGMGGVRHSAAIWHIPEALVTWRGVTGDTSPHLKAIPPSEENQARAGPGHSFTSHQLARPECGKG